MFFKDLMFALLLFIIGIIIIFLPSFFKHKLEAGKIPLCKIRCGARSYWYSMSYPIVRLYCYDDFFILSHWAKVIIFYNKVKSIEAKKILYLYKVTIEFEKKFGYEKVKIFFLTYKQFARFLSVLEEKLDKEKIKNFLSTHRNDFE